MMQSNIIFLYTIENEKIFIGLLESWSYIEKPHFLSQVEVSHMLEVNIRKLRIIFIDNAMRPM